MAIVALQHIEAKAREQGQPLLDDLQDTMDGLQGATEMRGTGERHIRLLPTKPIFEVAPSPALLKAASVPDSSLQHVSPPCGHCQGEPQPRQPLLGERGDALS